MINAIKFLFAFDCHGPQKDRRNRTRIIFWGFSWAVAWVLTAMAVKKDWIASKPLVGLCIAIVFALGMAMVFAYRRYLSHADELTRKIELDAMSFSLGIALVGGVAYSLITYAGLAPFGDVFSVVTMMASLTYIFGIFYGYRRFR